MCRSVSLQTVVIILSLRFLFDRLSSGASSRQCSTFLLVAVTLEIVHNYIQVALLVNVFAVSRSLIRSLEEISLESFYVVQ
jgi:hypothetical protein